MENKGGKKKKKTQGRKNFFFKIQLPTCVVIIELVGMDFIFYYLFLAFVAE
jgi:hypothetical protein